WRRGGHLVAGSGACKGAAAGGNWHGTFWPSEPMEAGSLSPGFGVTDMFIPKLIRAARLRSGHAPEEFAARVRITGEQLARFERGELAGLDSVLLLRIAVVLSAASARR